MVICITWLFVSVLVCTQHRHRLLNLGCQGLSRLQHVQQLSVVELQQHTSDFTGLFRVGSLDQGEQALT